MGGERVKVGDRSYYHAMYYSGTAHNGPSEKRTTSEKRTSS